METEDIWTYYFISDIEKDRKLNEIIAFERKLIAEKFINIIDKSSENIFGISLKTIQTYFEFIKEEFKEKRLTELLQREFELDEVEVQINDGVLGFKLTGQNRNIIVIEADVRNGRQGSKSFVFDSVAWIIKKLIIKRIKIQWIEEKYFRWFDSERAMKIIEVENQWGKNNFNIYQINIIKLNIYTSFFNILFQIVLFNDKKFKIKIKSKLNTFIYDFIISKLGTNLIPPFKGTFLINYW